MSNQNVTFEQMYAAIVSLTEAIKENTASRNNAVEQAVEKPEAEKPEAENENGITMELVEAALLEVKNKFGADEAKQIIKDIAGVARVKGIPEDKYQEVIDACEAKINEPETPETPADGTAEQSESAVTIEDVKAIAKEFGRQSQAHLAKAKEIIKNVGKADKIADVEPKYYAALIEALQNATLNEDDADL